jgi:hypothetical protein
MLHNAPGPSIGHREPSTPQTRQPQDSAWTTSPATLSPRTQNVFDSIAGWSLRASDMDALKVGRPISTRLKHKRWGAHTIQVKVRYSDFTTLTRQISVEEPITDAADIYRLGCFLLGREKLVSRPLRLLGLGVSNLREPSGQQLALL